jgi:nucleoside 2-deoxyribosyltransferase
VRVYLAVPQFGPASEAGRALVEAIQEAGHSLVNDPHDARRSFPLAQSERGAFVAEMDKLNAADLLVADASRPDAAVGWAVAWFLAKGRLVVLCCSKDARASLPALLAGNPSPWQKLVAYDDAAALRRQALEILTANG